MLLDGLGKRSDLHACSAGFQRVLKVRLRIKNRFKINPSLRRIRAVRPAGWGLSTINPWDTPPSPLSPAVQSPPPLSFQLFRALPLSPPAVQSPPPLSSSCSRCINVSITFLWTAGSKCKEVLGQMVLRAKWFYDSWF